MPKFDVLITRTVELSTTVTVSAKNEDQAEEKALQHIQQSTLTWSIEDKHEWNEESDDCRVDQIDEA